MRITCVTSRYLPNFRHLARLCEVDQAVVMDLAPLPDRNRDSFVNRNRIMNRGTAVPQWLTIPVLRSRGQSVRETRINLTDLRWPIGHINALRLCYPQHQQVAPGFVDGLSASLEMSDGLLLRANLAALAHLMRSLQCHSKFPVLQSSLVEDHAEFHRLAVATRLGASTYVAGSVEWELLTGSNEASLLRDAGIELVRSPDLPPEHFDSQLVTTLSCVHTICGSGLDRGRSVLNDLSQFLNPE